MLLPLARRFQVTGLLGLLCAGASFVLRAPVGNGEFAYRWSDGSTSPTLRVTRAGDYLLQRTNGCETRTVSRRVTYRSCVFIPNVITPNGDGLNDGFVATGLPPGPWSLAIYNRWGKQIFQTDTYQYDWGHGVPAGLYYYRLSQPTSSQTYVGWLEVAR